MDFEEIQEDGQEGGEGEDNFNQEMFMFGMEKQEADEMKQKKDSVIFLIDCNKSMHEKNPHNGEGHPSNIAQVLKAAHSFMKTKVITNENDRIGIILYGCKQSQNQLQLDNIYVF